MKKINKFLDYVLSNEERFFTAIAIAFAAVAAGNLLALIIAIIRFA